MMIVRYIFSLVLFCSVAWSVTLPKGIEEEQSTSETEEVAQPVAAKRSEVSVLCYHDFSETLSATEMRIQADSFAQQMQHLADLEVNVISLSDFIEWKQGKRELPAQNVMITIDDGWRSVYEVAFPVLKKHEFPFVLGLYTNFLGGGGKTLSDVMISVMSRHGMEIACHSASHPLPSKVKGARNQGELAYVEFMKTEFGGSKEKLEKRFKTEIESYVYPGGFYLKDMFPILREGGLNYAYTVKPGKITLETPNFELPRYVVLGTTPRIFDEALKFSIGNKRVAFDLEYPVKPSHNTSTSDRRPWVGVDLSNVENLDVNSVYMRVGGFGKVDAKFVKDTNRLEWQAIRPLRLPSYKVRVQWKLKGNSNYESPLNWEFYVDHKAEYTKLAVPE